MASGHSAAFVHAANAADITFTGHIGIREGDIYYFAVCANAAEQTNADLCVIVKVQPADGFAVAVKCACKHLVFGICANGRPLREVGAGVGVQFAVFV